MWMPRFSGTGWSSSTGTSEALGGEVDTDSLPLVSVLIPVYNAEEYINDAIRAALKQSWPRKEVIVVDDGSTDDSLSLARSVQAPELTVLHQEHQGASVARNHAVDVARGDYIQFLDADDVMARNKIELQMNRLRHEPSGTVASCRWGVFKDDPAEASFDDTNRTWLDFSDPVEWLTKWAEGKGGTRPHAWLTPTSVIRQAGPWNEELSINQDGEFFTRVLLNSNGVAFCQDTEVYYRLTESGVSSRRGRSAAEDLYWSTRLICSHILNYENTQRTRSLCAAKWDEFRHRVYPTAPDLVRRAEDRIETLGGSDRQFGGSRLYQCVRSIVGWKVATRLQSVYRRIRYGKDGQQK